jgi:hypothetical protein
MGPRADLDRCGKSRPHRDSMPGPSAPNLYGLMYPAHTCNLLFIIIFCGSVAQRGLWPPRSRGCLITHNDAPQSIGFLRKSDQLVAETST